MGVWWRESNREAELALTPAGERSHEEDSLAADFSLVAAEQTVSEGPTGRSWTGDVPLVGSLI